MNYSGLSATTNCAGQFCEQRARCHRYHMVSQPNTKWASLDIERALTGTCAAYVPVGTSFNRRKKDSHATK